MLGLEDFDRYVDEHGGCAGRSGRRGRACGPAHARRAGGDRSRRRGLGGARGVTETNVLDVVDGLLEQTG